jgi:hypothetical protein
MHNTVQLPEYSSSSPPGSSPPLSLFGVLCLALRAPPAAPLRASICPSLRFLCAGCGTGGAAETRGGGGFCAVPCEGEEAPKNCVMSCVPAVCSVVVFFRGIVCCVTQKREVEIFCRDRFAFVFYVYNTKWEKGPLIFFASLSFQETSKENGRDNAAVLRTILDKQEARTQ